MSEYELLRKQWDEMEAKHLEKAQLEVELAVIKERVAILACVRSARGHTLNGG